MDELKELEARRTRCEVYSRIVGYLRPVGAWNAGKREEFRLRWLYDRFDLNAQLQKRQMQLTIKDVV